MKNYSQNDEQEVILKYFGDFRGTFLDIGAYNGTDLSNTRALLELGWTGVLVEPNPYNLVPLIESVRPFAEKVIVVAAAIGVPQPSQLFQRLFLDDSPGRGWAACAVAGKPGIIEKHPVPLVVPVVSPYAIYEGFPQADTISIDAEYMDWDILKLLPRDMVEACRLLVIEAVNRQEMKDYLTDTCGFKIHHETPENIIAAR